MKNWLENLLALVGGFATLTWNVVSENAAAIQALATIIAAGLALAYLIVTNKLWRETRASNLIKQLEYLPDVFVSLEDPTRMGYRLQFSNQGRLGVVIKCDMFIDFAECVPGKDRIEETEQPVRHVEFNLAPGKSRAISIDTFFELAKRELGQYAPHLFKIKGDVALRASQQKHPPVASQIIDERFHCIMNKQARHFIPANKLLDPNQYDWAWLIFNLSERHTVPQDKVQPWPEKTLPEEYRPSNNNTQLYMKKRLQNAYGELLGPHSQQEKSP